MILVSSFVLRDQRILLLQKFGEFAILRHGDHNIMATNEFVFDIQLWDGWPFTELLDTLTKFVILQNIESCKLLRIDTLIPQDLNSCPRKPAHRLLWRSLHEENHWCRRNGLRDCFSRLGREETGQSRSRCPQRWTQEALQAVSNRNNNATFSELTFDAVNMPVLNIFVVVSDYKLIPCGSISY